LQKKSLLSEFLKAKNQRQKKKINKNKKIKNKKLNATENRVE